MPSSPHAQSLKCNEVKRTEREQKQRCWVVLLLFAVMFVFMFCDIPVDEKFGD